MPKLYELSQAYNELLEVWASDDSPVADDAEASATMLATLEAIEGEVASKMCNSAKVVLEIEALYDRITAKLKLYNDRRKALEKRADWLRQYIKDQALAAGIPKADDGEVKVSVTTVNRTNYTFDEALLKNSHPEYFKPVITEKFDRKGFEQLLQTLPAGELPPGVTASNPVMLRITE
jgi:hypothetical protein